MIEENITRDIIGDILTFITGSDEGEAPRGSGWKLPDGELPTVLKVLLDLLEEKELVKVDDGFAYISCQSIILFDGKKAFDYSEDSQTPIELSKAVSRVIHRNDKNYNGLEANEIKFVGRDDYHISLTEILHYSWHHYPGSGLIDYYNFMRFYKVCKEVCENIDSLEQKFISFKICKNITKSSLETFLDFVGTSESQRIFGEDEDFEELRDCVRNLCGCPEIRKDISNFLDSFAKSEENKDWKVMSKAETVETILSFLDGYSGRADFLKENFLKILTDYLKEYEKKIPDMCGAITALFYISKNLKDSDEIIKSLGKTIDNIDPDRRELLEECDTLSDYLREIDDDTFMPYIDAILAKTASPEYILDNVEKLSALGVLLAIATDDALDERYEEARDRILNYVTEVEISEDDVRDDLEDFYKDLLETNPGILLNAMDMDEDKFRDIYRDRPTDLEVSIGMVTIYINTDNIIHNLR